jgi:peptidoglycan/xylan/chitin deacetylase (PgdA/CDA1 family)
MSHARNVALIGGLATAAAAAYAGPALAGIGPLRRGWLPAVAGQGDPRHVALTFDDGPHEEATPELLRLLDIAGVRATFFLLGRMVAEQPGVARAIVAGGHEVAVHGYDHGLLLKRGPRATLDDLTRATETIAEVAGVAPRWWRPPYGVATTTAVRAARRLGLTPVLWTCWGRDWTPTTTPDSVFRSVLRKLDGGGTILLHDSDHAAAPRCYEAMLGALPAILTACRARGLEVGPLADHGLVRRTR